MSNYFYETDKNGTRMRVDKKTGEKIPVDDIVNQAITEGKLKTMEQQMADKHAKQKKDIDTIKEV